MTRRKKMLANLRSTTQEALDSIETKIELDNLDSASLIIEDGEVVVENEHGTTFDLDELTNVELECFHSILGYSNVFDYVILTKDNRWVASGFQETEKELEDTINELEDEDLSNLVIVRAEVLTFGNILT